MCTWCTYYFAQISVEMRVEGDGGLTVTNKEMSGVIIFGRLPTAAAGYAVICETLLLLRHIWEEACGSAFTTCELFTPNVIMFDKVNL